MISRTDRLRPDPEGFPRDAARDPGGRRPVDNWTRRRAGALTSAATKQIGDEREIYSA